MTRSLKAVFASSNAGKLSELRSLLSPFHIEIIPQSELAIPDIEETGLTFIENAILKARHASSFSRLPAIADDSGLVIDALHGAPGIYSARYAGIPANMQHNIEKVLAQLQTVPAEKRTAHFHCSLVYLQNAEDPAPLIAEGMWHGSILSTPSGTRGFGYDPIFFDTVSQCSAAELSLDEKNKRSHRGNALRKLITQLNMEAGSCTRSS